MIDASDICALVPFRSGSKGLANKNILELLGRPLFSYSLQFAKHLNLKTVVSTDYMSNVLEPYLGQSGYIKRPVELSGDHSPIEDTIAHALENNEFSKFNYCLLLQPTSPLRSSILFQKLLLSVMAEAEDTMCLTVAKKPNHHWKVGYLEDGKLRNISGENRRFFVNRQSLPSLYAPDGNMYLFSIDGFKRNRNFLYSNLKAVVNEPLASFDIDSSSDFDSVERIIKKAHKTKGFEWLVSDYD